VSNHDKNAWDGTEFEQFADGLLCALVLSFTGDGMPLIYNGQEAASPKRLAFFERDPIEWREHPLRDMYRQLINLKKTNSALANGAWGALMRHIPNSAPSKVFSFVRQHATNKVFVLLNFSAQAQEVECSGHLHHGSYQAYFTQQNVEIRASSKIKLDAWGYTVLVGQ